MKKAFAHLPSAPVGRAPFTQRVRLAGGLAVIGLIAGLGLLLSRPAHTAGGPIAVNVANTPLAVTLAGNAAGQQPFAAATDYRFLNDALSASVDTADGYQTITVPAGKRLIIQTVSARANGGGGSSRFQASIGTTANGSLQFFTLPIVSDFGIPFAGATQSVTLTCDSGTAIPFECWRANPLSTQYIRVAVSGYLVDTP